MVLKPGKKYCDFDYLYTGNQLVCRISEPSTVGLGISKEGTSVCAFFKVWSPKPTRRSNRCPARILCVTFYRKVGLLHYEAIFSLYDLVDRMDVLVHDDRCIYIYTIIIF